MHPRSALSLWILTDPRGAAERDHREPGHEATAAHPVHHSDPGYFGAGLGLLCAPHSSCRWTATRTTTSAAAQRYAQFIAAGDVRGLADYAYGYEHPPLAKLAYGLALAPLPQTPLLVEPPSGGPRVDKLPQPQMRVSRTVAIVTRRAGSVGAGEPKPFSWAISCNTDLGG